MIKRFGWIFFIALMVLFVTACSEPEEPEPEATSVGGSVLETGYELDEDMAVISPQINFQANEDFYFSFDNNQPFGVDEVTVQLINSANDEVIAQNKYDVDPELQNVYDLIFFGSPGRYKILVEVGGETRATREIIIE